MIKHTNFRNGEKISQYNERPAQALISMSVFELGYGGTVTEWSSTRIVVDTLVFSVRDRTIFEGSEDEMRFLVTVAGYHAAITSDGESRQALIGETSAFLGKLPDGNGGLPFVVATLGPFYMGKLATTAALLYAAGITEPEEIGSLFPIPLKDLVAAVQLSHELGMPLPEIMRETSAA